MRRPLLSARVATATALLLVAAAATPADAQRDRVLRRAFDPAVTPFVGVAGFGSRATGVLDPATYDFKNSLALGVQLDRPLSRRTGFMATVAVAPLSAVNATRAGDIEDLGGAVAVGMDLGFAARLKPSAPLFVYLGGGGLYASRRAAGEVDGSTFDPRASFGVGVDLMRFERAGFRVMYLGHYAFPAGSPDEARWTSKSSTYDQTIILGGRFTLGGTRTEP